EDVKRRNQEDVLLTGYQPKFHVHLLTSKEVEQRNQEEAKDDKPRVESMCILSFALPGYANDGNTAYVFFLFADGSYHGGGDGVYCLTKQDGIWQVTWKEYGFYF